MQATRIVLLLCFAAVVVNAAVTCKTRYICAGLGESCQDDTTTDRQCSAGLTSSYNASYYCTCATASSGPTPSYNLGDECTNSMSWYAHRCLPATAGSSQLRWFSNKKMGDSCSSATNYDCLPPRMCSSGKCTGSLAIGDTCWNTTVSYFLGDIGLCPVNAYCSTKSLTTGATKAVGQCTARITAGGSCRDEQAGTDNLNHPCEEPYLCLNNVCQLPDVFFLDAGMKFNRTNQCKSGFANYTSGSGVCGDYDMLYNAANAKKGLDCTEDTDCGLIGTFYNAQCRCNGEGTQNKPVCTGSILKTPATYSSDETRMRTTAKTLYDAGCELNYVTNTGSDTTSTAWCYNRVRSSSSTSEYCAAAAKSISFGVPDCQGVYAAVCASFRTMSSSIVAVIVLIAAAVFGASN